MAGKSGGDRAKQARQILETDLYLFAKYINPQYIYGDVHEEVFHWLQNDGPHGHQLLLMPRGHLKSHCIAVWCVWQITKDPCTTILYLSAGEDLASVQIYAIKNMITCDRYRKLWPEMVNREEAKRDKWTAWAFNVDHPKRKMMGVRDTTLLIKTVKSNFTGLHCDIIVFDDVVVPNNAYTEIGRKEVRAAISQCTSIQNIGGITKCVGTRYHPADAYTDFKDAIVNIWSEEAQEFTEEASLWDILEFVVEDHGDGTGQFLWPKTISPIDGKPYGYDIQELAKIRSRYFSQGENAQYYAQYYQDPNDPSSEKVSRDSVQYYNPNRLKYIDGHYFYAGKRLALSSAMDVAWTINKKSDYTAICVIGVDCDWNIYVLALERFKTQDYDEYYSHVEGLHRQYDFRKLYIETNAGGTLVASEVKRRLRQNGSILQIIGKPAVGNEGKKEERHSAVLIPRVKNGQLFFAKGGLTQVAIEEIVLERPPHDDLKDVLTSAIKEARPPANARNNEGRNNVIRLRSNSRFGGIRRGY